jgi:hypothetical protein
MVTQIKSDLYIGIPMIAPITWEENIAANMTKIPAFEFFPGVLVSDLYKAYREGITTGKINSWDSTAPDDLVVGYISDTSRKRADIVRDFLDAMVKTVAAGKAPASVLTGGASTGIAEKTGAGITSAVSAVKFPLFSVAIIAGSVVLLYAMSQGFLPKLRAKEI